MAKFSRKISRGMRTSRKKVDRKKRFRKSGKYKTNMKKRYGREGSKH